MLIKNVLIFIDMDKLIDIWVKLGYFVYWLFWIGSVALFNISVGRGIIIGIIAFIIHIIILHILWYIEYKEWLWKD